MASTLVTRRSQWTSTSLEASVAKFVTFHGNVNFSPQKCIAPTSEMYCTNLGNVLRYEAFHRSRVSNYIDPSLDVEVLSYTAAIVLGSSSEERFENRSTAFQHHVINSLRKMQRGMWLFLQETETRTMLITVQCTPRLSICMLFKHQINI